MRAKDKCPSCFQPVSPTDFLCANCELILDASQVPERPVGDVSVVRRMLEAPQRGMTAGKPNPRPPRSSPTEGMEGPTKKLDLGPELSGVPVVVATLTGKAVQLSEFEAWVVSLIDGLSDAVGLAKSAGVRELELRVVLRTLQEKKVIDFADEPLSDADLDMPQVLGTLDEEDELQTAPGLPDPRQFGANTDRRDGRFVAPPSKAASHANIPPMPENLPLAPPRAAVVIPPIPDNLPLAPPPREPIVTGRRGPLIRAGRAAMLPAGGDLPTAPGGNGVAGPYPSVPAEERTGLPPARAVSTRPPAPPLPKPERTDPRIAYSGNVNRKVLDALAKVKRVEAPASANPQKELPVADVLARDTLQVALRMEQGGRLDEAIRFLEKSIAQSPEAASLYNRLGIILMRERADFRRAETLIRKAIELAPDNTVYSTNLQQVLSNQALRSHR
ncbi:MAG: tetratricopeptide repeat protein [Archangium sp.]|nr:tetratricopeptide repeat protein [Archangium sp.]MDP3154414.1 tetratricopeptide repeat protein [Archangium sp.]MDP3572981.1 tetratricopeptide repeat protein [Archangium sp.]